MEASGIARVECIDVRACRSVFGRIAGRIAHSLSVHVHIVVDDRGVVVRLVPNQPYAGLIIGQRWHAWILWHIGAGAKVRFDIARSACLKIYFLNDINYYYFLILLFK